MKEPVQIPLNHQSYDVHRRQFWLQIILPMALIVVLIVVVAVLLSISALGGTGDSAIWAAISTIWLVIPAMLFGFIFLATLAGLVYLLARALDVMPDYSLQAQYYFDRAVSSIMRASDAATRPFIFLDSVGASLKAIFRKF